MSQNDFIIANQSAPDFRSDLNDALQALASLSSGATAPSTTYANMLWYDTANNILKMRSEADDAWISIAYLDQSANAFRILDDTQVVNTSGTQTGVIGDQATGTWETGTATTESLVSPAKVKAAIEALAPAQTSDLELISTASFSSASSVDISLPTTYVGFEILLEVNSQVGVAPPDLRCAYSNDGGSTFEVSSYNEATPNSTFSFSSFITIAEDLSSSVKTDIKVTVLNPSESDHTNLIANSAGPGGYRNISGKRSVSEIVNAIQFFATIGAITGSYYLYGYRSS